MQALPDSPTTSNPEMSEAFACPCCGGPYTILGKLGRLWWVRCRNCGIEVKLSAEQAGTLAAAQATE
jgi:transcription elongation factor Elf1